jgi:hypothetical protein
MSGGIYVLCDRQSGDPLYIGVSGTDIRKRAGAHLRATGLLARNGIDPATVEVLFLPMPNASAPMIGSVELGLIACIGRRYDGTGTLLNIDAGGAHARSAAHLSAAAIKAHTTRRRSAAAKKAAATRARAKQV